MDEDAVLLAIGQLQGKMDGIGREIGEIKEVLKCKSEDCTTCRREIDGRIDTIAKKHTGEEAVESLFDKGIVKAGIVIGAICGVAGLILAVVG